MKEAGEVMMHLKHHLHHHLIKHHQALWQVVATYLQVEEQLWHHHLTMTITKIRGEVVEIAVMVQEEEVVIGVVEGQGMEITQEVIGMLHVVVQGMTQEETQGVTQEETQGVTQEEIQGVTQEEKAGEIGGVEICVVTCVVVKEISDKNLVEGMIDGVVIIEME